MDDMDFSQDWDEEEEALIVTDMKPLQDDAKAKASESDNRRVKRLDGTIVDAFLYYNEDRCETSGEEDSTKNSEENPRNWCRDCGKEFKRKATLNAHVCSQVLCKRFQCSVCAATFNTRYRLEEHEDSACSQIGAYSCKRCGKRFMNEKLLMAHVISHDDFDYKRRKRSARDEDLYYRESKRRNSENLVSSSRKQLEVPDRDSVQNAKSLIDVDSDDNEEDNDNEDDEDDDDDDEDEEEDVVVDDDDDERITFEKDNSKDMPWVYECYQCNKQFKQKRYLKSHSLIHSTRNPCIICDLCGLSFDNSITAKEHAEFHKMADENPLFRCPKSIKIYKFVRRMDNSEFSIRPVVYNCCECNHVLRGRIEMQTHIYLHLSHTLTCPFCNMKHSDQRALSFHVFFASFLKQICKLCKAVCGDEEGLAKHMRFHPKCSECKRLFYNPNELNRHFPCKTASQPQCMVCKRTFTTPLELQFHLPCPDIVHKPIGNAYLKDDDGMLLKFKKDGTFANIMCPVCKKVFRSSYDMGIHLQSRWQCKTYSNIPRCKVCKKMFATTKELKSHLPCSDLLVDNKDSEMTLKHKIVDERAPNLVQTSLRNDQRFSSAVNKGFKGHYTGIDLYRNVSSMTFVKQQEKQENVLIHRVRHTGKNDFLCSKCGKPFPIRPTVEQETPESSGKNPPENEFVYISRFGHKFRPNKGVPKMGYCNCSYFNMKKSFIEDDDSDDEPLTMISEVVIDTSEIEGGGNVKFPFHQRNDNDQSLGRFQSLSFQSHKFTSAKSNADNEEELEDSDSYLESDVVDDYSDENNDQLEVGEKAVTPDQKADNRGEKNKVREERSLPDQKAENRGENIKVREERSLPDQKADNRGENIKVREEGSLPDQKADYRGEKLKVREERSLPDQKADNRGEKIKVREERSLPDQKADYRGEKIQVREERSLPDQKADNGGEKLKVREERSLPDQKADNRGEKIEVREERSLPDQKADNGGEKSKVREERSLVSQRHKEMLLSLIQNRKEQVTSLTPKLKEQTISVTPELKKQVRSIAPKLKKQTISVTPELKNQVRSIAPKLTDQVSSLSPNNKDKVITTTSVFPNNVDQNQMNSVALKCKEQVSSMSPNNKAKVITTTSMSPNTVRQNNERESVKYLNMSNQKHDNAKNSESDKDHNKSAFTSAFEKHVKNEKILLKVGNKIALCYKSYKFGGDKQLMSCVKTFGGLMKAPNQQGGKSDASSQKPVQEESKEVSLQDEMSGEPSAKKNKVVMKVPLKMFEELFRQTGKSSSSFLDKECFHIGRKNSDPGMEKNSDNGAFSSSGENWVGEIKAEDDIVIKEEVVDVVD